MKNKTARYHFIGIGGIGMSALARILLDKKMWVSGSDPGTSPILDDLRARGAVISSVHSARNIGAEDTVVFSSAVREDNPEFQAAIALNCKMLHRSELLAQLMEDHNTIAVAGTHGKTTTSALLTALFIESKLDPTFAIGGLLEGQNGRPGKGGHFLFEADESDGSFLNYFPDYALVTNLEPEHMDHYKTEEELEESFSTFFSQVEKKLIYCGDDVRLRRLSPQGMAYGFSAGCAWHLSNFVQKGWRLFFDLTYEGRTFEAIEVALIGRHNALNAAAVFALAHLLHIDERAVRLAFKRFPGVKRRCEKKGEEHGILRIDDYAHHPTELSVALRSIKEAVGERRVVALFQPHRYCRTADHLKKFGKAFDWADLLYVTDIFQARELPIPGLSAHSVIDKVKQHSTLPVHYVSRADCVEEMRRILRPHDVFVTLGAGDIAKVQQPFHPQKWKVGVVSGGRSPEHAISLRSGKFVEEALNPHLYDVTSFHISRSGEWSIGEERGGLARFIERIDACEIFLPILHGPNGEDGTIQGFFETLQKAYVGCDHLASALCMHKVMAKELAQKAGVPTPSFVHFHHYDWLKEKERFLAHNLTYPLYVKPVRMGSSLGVVHVKEASALEEAIAHAFRFDTQVLLEEGKCCCRELEFACVGNAHGLDVRTPPPGEKLARGEFVDYEKKYGQEAVSTSVHPTLSKKTLEEGKRLAEQVYRALGCSGLARVDFLLDPQEKWWFFEINALPGMQPLSLFPKIWEREGTDASSLIDRLITLALARQNMHNRIR